MPEISLLELFFTFFYIGLFTIGGGLVAITLMQQAIVERGIINSDTFYNMVAISESTPGPIGVNMATYIGYNLYGIPGAIITTFGEVLPSIICILLIAKFLSSFQEKPLVKTMFTFLRPTSTGLIFVAAANIIEISLLNLPNSILDIKTKQDFVSIFNWQNITFYILMLILSLKTKVNPLVIILLGAIFGIIFM